MKAHFETMCMFFETVLSVGWSVGRGFSSEGNQLSCNIGTREPQYPFFCRLSFACRSRELELHKYTFLFRRRSSQALNVVSDWMNRGVSSNQDACLRA